MTKKIKKNLFLADWAVELLDKEGEKYDGPGTVASASIMAFCRLNETDKRDVLKKYRNEEINRAYAVEDEEVAAQSVPAGQKRTLLGKTSKAS